MMPPEVPVFASYHFPGPSVSTTTGMCSSIQVHRPCSLQEGLRVCIAGQLEWIPLLLARPLHAGMLRKRYFDNLGLETQ